MSAKDIVAANSQAWQDADKFIRLRIAEAAIARVRKLHAPSADAKPGCLGCGINPEYCDWNEPWPCPTIQALDGDAS